MEFKKDAQGNFPNFQTKTTKYTTIQPGQSLGIIRFTEYEKMKIVLGMGKSFAQIIEAWKEIRTLLAADKPFADIRSEAILYAASVERGVIEFSKMRYSQAFYICALFILREGEDKNTFSIDVANEKIEDWAAAGLDENDLFFFALNTINGFSENYQRIKKEVETQAARWGIML